MSNHSELQKDYDRILKINFFGDSYVGKTSMIFAYVYNKYDEKQYCSIGVDFLIKRKDVNNVRYRVMLWDMCGSQRYYQQPTGLFRKTNGVVLLYSIDNRNTFEDIGNLMDRINQYCDIEVPRILVGSKCDLKSKRVVSYAEGEKLALERGYKFFECSSKDSINVLQAVDYMIEMASVYEIKLFQSEPKPVLNNQKKEEHNLKKQENQSIINKCFG